MKLSYLLLCLLLWLSATSARASYGAYHPASFTFTNESNYHRLWGASYDGNGNVLTLRRRGLTADATRTAPAAYGETDNLRYSYQAGTNRLTHPDDLTLSFPSPLSIV